MYEINKLLHGKRFVRDFHTRWFCIRNPTRSLRPLVRFQILHQLVWKSRTHALPWSNLYVLTFPTKSTSMVNRVITQFVWNKIRYRTMIEQGGLHMPDFRIINEALKVVWVRKGLLKTKCASEKGLLAELQKRRYDHSR